MPDTLLTCVRADGSPPKLGTIDTRCKQNIIKPSYNLELYLEEQNKEIMIGTDTF